MIGRRGFITGLVANEHVCSRYCEPRLHPRSPWLDADFVAYGCEYAASMSLWMVPGTHPDDPGKVIR